jgi:hypothetical protein
LDVIASVYIAPSYPKMRGGVWGDRDSIVQGHVYFGDVVDRVILTDARVIVGRGDCVAVVHVSDRSPSLVPGFLL